MKQNKNKRVVVLFSDKIISFLLQTAAIVCLHFRNRVRNCKT